MRTRQAHEWMGALTSPGGRLLSVASPQDEGIENFFDDIQFWTDNTEFPDGYRLMDQSAHPERYEHAYWMTAGEKSEMTTEWIKVYNVNYGGINSQISTAGGANGFFMVRGGRYVPQQVGLGRTTNTDDWSTKYDAVRGFLWDHWTGNNASDSHTVTIANRPSAGSSNFGSINFEVSRNYTYKWRIWTADGNGNVTDNYLAGVPDCNNDSCALQWEFVKGSHVTLKMYTNVASALNFSTFVPPTWPIAASGYYVTVDLSGAGLNALTPITPSYIAGSAVEAQNGRIGRFCYELRGIGNDWEHLT